MALNKKKTDPKLGKLVGDHLRSIGHESPEVKSDINDDQKIEKIKELFSGIMETIGLDLNNDSLADTPNRLAKMYVNEIFWGMDESNFPKCTTVENKFKYDEMILEENISVQSNCEHHFVIIDGMATVAYIPGNKIIGLSKINRVVEYFSKRPQIQERLTAQIWHTLSYILETKDVAVMIRAKHYCVKSRGVEDVNSSTVTSKLGGIFRDNIHTRNEFMILARGT